MEPGQPYDPSRGVKKDGVEFGEVDGGWFVHCFLKITLS